MDFKLGHYQIGDGLDVHVDLEFNSGDGTTGLPTLPGYKAFERFPQKSLHAGESVPLQQEGAPVWHTVGDRPFGEGNQRPAALQYL